MSVEKKYMHSETYDCFVNNYGLGIDMVVYECGYEKCEPLHCWGPDEKVYYVLHYVISGKGKLYYGDKVYEIHAGQMFFLSPNVVSFYEADCDSPWEYKWVGFNGVSVHSIIENTQFSDSNPIIDCQDGETIIKLLDNIFFSFKSEFTPNLQAVGNMYLFLSWITETFPNKTRNEDSINEQRFYNILRFINLRYLKKLKVSDIAKALHYDRTYIYKLFMKNIGISPSEYIENLRLKKACELIQSKQGNLCEIALSIGYDNYNWFFIVFKRKFAISPQEFAELDQVERMRFDHEKLKKIDLMLQNYKNFMDKNMLL